MERVSWLGLLHARFRPFKQWVRSSVDLVSKLRRHVYCSLIKWSEEGTKFTPTRGKVVLSLMGFLLYLVVGLLAINFPAQGFRIAVRATSVTLFLVLGLKVAYDLSQPPASNAKYDRNLANGMLVVMISLIVLTALYEKRWYNKLTTMVVEVRQDVVLNPRFPAVALSQDMLATYQAQLVPQPLKCFLNKFDEEAPMCHSLSRPELLTAHSYNCNDSWVAGVQQRFEAPGSKQGSYYVSFRPDHDIISRGAGVYMTLHAFFKFNTSNPGGHSVPSPVLWIMVYDPDISFEEAYTGGYGPLNLLNANGVTAINIGLNFFEPAIGFAYYKYDVKFSTAENLNLVCDVTKNATELCHASLIIQIPRFDRTVQTEKMSMQWPDVIAEVGAYFALVQILSWIVPGQVLASYQHDCPRLFLWTSIMRYQKVKW